MRVRGCGWPKSPVFVSMSKDSKALRTETVKAMPAEIRMDPAIWPIWKDEAMKLLSSVRICSPPLSTLSGHEAALRGCWALSGASKLCEREKTWKDSKILNASLGLLIRLIYLRILESTVSFIYLVDLWSFLISLKPSFPFPFPPFPPFSSLSPVLSLDVPFISSQIKLPAQTEFHTVSRSRPVHDGFQCPDRVISKIGTLWSNCLSA